MRAMVCLLLVLSAVALVGATEPTLGDGDRIVFTAHQGWLSRIYLLYPDGSVDRYIEYEFYYLADLEIVHNDVYLAEAFAPRVLKLDLESDYLDVVVDDWSLYYFYDVGFDGAHWYVTEWDLNKYEFDGTKVGTVSFAYDTRGGTWDGEYYWTLADDNLVRCWDVSDWPTMVELPELAITPPSDACRGLWFDGANFWTAESIEDTLGYIYVFDHGGNVVDQWLAPAYQGFAAGVIRGVTPADMNCDGYLNFDDVNPFVLAQSGADEYYAEFPHCNHANGDVDGNGVVNFDDIDGFIDLLVGGG